MQLICHGEYYTSNASESYFLESAHNLPAIVEKFEKSMEKSS